MTEAVRGAPPSRGRAARSPTPAQLASLLAALFTALCFAPPAPADIGPEPLELTERLGNEIDPTERTAYHLLPDVEGFLNASFFRWRDRVRFRYMRLAGTRTETEETTLSRDDWDLVQRHARIVERHAALVPDASGCTEAEALYRTALRYGARARYDLASALGRELAAEFPTDPTTLETADTRSDIERLAEVKRALFLSGSFLDQSGRTDLLVFSGTYGLWLGIAAPVAFREEGAKEIALGLILAVPVSLGTTAYLTRNVEIGRGRASMIALGGSLGTWQGIGWAASPDGDDDNHDLVKAGLLAGLGGVAAATLLTSHAEITEGHGALASFALPWGAWLGVAGAGIADSKDEKMLRAALIGSDALVGTALVLGRGARFSQARARLVSLMGVGGAAFGLGIDVLTENDDDRNAFALAGAGSIGGALLGLQLTRRYDDRRFSSASGLGLEPLLASRAVRGFDARLEPSAPTALVGLGAAF